MTERARYSEVPQWIVRLPRWQHLTYAVLSVLALAAAVYNAVTSHGGRQLVHASIAVVLAGVTISLLAWYRRRPSRPV